MLVLIYKNNLDHLLKRIKFLQAVGVSRAEGQQIVNYMKEQKYMFTKWTSIDITKELNAKISQEVYS